MRHSQEPASTETSELTIADAFTLQEKQELSFIYKKDVIIVTSRDVNPHDQVTKIAELFPSVQRTLRRLTARTSQCLERPLGTS